MELAVRRTAAWIVAFTGITLVALILSGIRTSRAESGDAASAIGSLRAVNSAQAMFASSCAGGYATDLADLVKKPEGSSHGFISPDLSHNGIVKSNYLFTVTREMVRVPDIKQVPTRACVQSASPLASSYFASAVPLDPTKTGATFFATDARGTIYQSTSGPIPNPIPLSAKRVQ